MGRGLILINDLAASPLFAKARELDPESRHYVEFSWRLDTTQLPRPMQIGLSGISGASEWSLGVERSVRLSADAGK